MNNSKKSIIVITGAIASGKTSFLFESSSFLKRNWVVEGVLSFSSKRKIRSNQPALSYNVQTIKSGNVHSWATREKLDGPFEFDLDVRVLIEKEIDDSIAKDTPELFILDNLGTQEIEDKGFSKLLKDILKSDISTIVLSVKKRVLEEFFLKFEIINPTVVDLDFISKEDAKISIIKTLKELDSENIGIFASMTSLMEVGLGSTLSAFKMPFKGTFLAYLQNFMLILFSKKLNGRGVFWIVLITAGLKSFSIAGNRLRPMFYIFVQGGLFLVPIKMLGLNYISVLIGSVMMSWCTVLLSLGFKFLIFGTSFIEAYVTAASKIFSYLGLDGITFWHIILFSLALRTVIAPIVCTCAYYLNLDRFLKKLEDKVTMGESNEEITFDELKKSSWKNSLLEGGQDMLSRRYILPFVFISLVIFFFTKLDIQDYFLVLTRALVLSWIGFVLSRRIDFLWIVEKLRQRELNYVADGMIKAITVVNSLKRKK